MSDINERPSLLRAASMPEHLRGGSFNVVFNARARRELQQLLNVDSTFLSNLEQKVRTEVLKHISSEQRRPYSVVEGRRLMSIGVRNMVAEQRQTLLDAVQTVVEEYINQPMRVPTEFDEATGRVTAWETQVKKITDTEIQALKRYARVGFGAQPRATKQIAIPFAEGTREYNQLRQRLRSVFGPGGRSGSVAGGFVHYVEGGISAIAGPRGGQIRVSEAVHKAIQDVQKESEASVAKENELLASAFPGQHIPSAGDPRRSDLLVEARKIERAKHASAMSDTQAESAARARIDKALRVQTATELAMARRAGIDVDAPDRQLQVAGWAARHNISASEWTRISPALRNEINKARSMYRLENMEADTEYVRRQELLKQSLKDRRAQAMDEYYTTGAGRDTEYGKRYRERRQRQQELEQMRGAGRVGRTLRRLGVSAKTAGRVGRAFGKVGSAMLIAAIITAIGKAILSALNRLTDAVMRVGQNATANLLGNVFTGVTDADQRLYTQFAAFASAAGGGTFDINATNQRVANKIGNIVTNPAGAESAIRGAALLSAASRFGGINPALNAVLKGETDISVLTNNMLAAALTGVFRNNTLFGQNATAVEYGQYLAQAGMDSAELGFLIQQLRKSGNIGVRETFLTQVARVQGNPEQVKALVDGLRRQLSVAGVIEQDVSTPLRTEAISDVTDAFADELTSLAAILKMVKENLVLAFGDDLLNIIESLHAAFINFLVFIDKLIPGQQFTGLTGIVQQTNRNRLREDEQALSTLRGAVPAYRQTAENIWLNHFRRTIDGRPESSDAVRARLMRAFQNFGGAERFGTGTMPAWVTEQNKPMFMASMQALRTEAELKNIVAQGEKNISVLRRQIHENPNIMRARVVTQTPVMVAQDVLNRTTVELEQQVSALERVGVRPGTPHSPLYGRPTAMANAIARYTAGSDVGIVNELMRSTIPTILETARNIKAMPTQLELKGRFDDININITTPPEIRATAPTRIENTDLRISPPEIGGAVRLQQ